MTRNDEVPQEVGEALARAFHEAYERLAPTFGYATRADTREFDPASPNGRLMIAVCNEVTATLRAKLEAAEGEVARLRDEAGEAVYQHDIQPGAPRAPLTITSETAADVLHRYLANAPDGDHWPPERQRELRIEAMRNAVTNALEAAFAAGALSQIRPGYRHVVHELLTNIKRACVRGRNVASAEEASFIATCDHVESMAEQALGYFATAPAQGGAKLNDPDLQRQMENGAADFYRVVAALNATPPSAPAVADAEAMGASGGPANELERLAFEAWMRGHCWALSATWNGTEYRSDAEQCGRCCPQAATTRMLWAAWRDRAALSAPVPQEGVPQGMVERLEAALKRVEDGRAPRRIPADPSDVDLALAEVIAWLKGEASPFWLAAAPAQGVR